MKNLPANSAAPHKAAILAIILVSYVMIVLDTSIVLTGLSKIHHDLGFTDTGLAWVQSAYTLTFGGLLLLAARAAHPGTIHPGFAANHVCGGARAHAGHRPVQRRGRHCRQRGHGAGRRAG
ncbi:hypothetical protein [Janthinobacterium sp. DSP2-3-3]|uniref:hypothetical protein n=1 Tax=Janthinobacterium sp. DSP2-3-3 TaxID=2804596 RepID=UPI003CF7B1F3